MLGSRGVRRHPYCWDLEQKSDLGGISVQVVLSQLKMANLDCWCPGESVDTHIVGVANKKDKVTSAFPSVCRHPYYRDLEQKRSDLGVISVQVVLSQLCLNAKF